MVLVDTSAWIHFLRPDGDEAVRARVEGVLRAGTARLCPLVRLELWNGAGGERERKVLRELERSIPELDVTADVWGEARDLARRCRAAGASVPATDLLIAACAFHHGARIEHEDADFDAIERVAGRGANPR
jgi:predicted nucleic acid-binding protein